MSDQPKPTESQPKLEPFPFCGEPGHCEKFSHGGNDFFMLGCKKPGCAGQTFKITMFLDRAIAAWNRRSPGSADPQLAAKLLDAIGAFKESFPIMAGERGHVFAEFPALAKLYELHRAHRG